MATSKSTRKIAPQGTAADPDMTISQCLSMLTDTQRMLADVQLKLLSSTERAEVAQQILSENQRIIIESHRLTTTHVVGVTDKQDEIISNQHTIITNQNTIVNFLKQILHGE
ncbi:MAG: hypothetical protein J0I17_11435 ['Candidatus Kapabacteria' thiocyanatum]|uniref:Uncharacterized protein n=1 Tax=Candidatus Kapaibacterium thiocyanatum TaxID=1895771 RepID=A0A1M3KYS5_9BACT|nr:hypothetical protein ['Candidatus Kapabacteria' thiocyanatum]OJX57639.1 MAG: hypothetical protein BGO89_06615 ['Candidatus Kapabacteria' thiocyanatum]